MNARQKAKKYKKKINTLESDNDLMRRIIADSPTMQELYDAYNKPMFVTRSTMQFQEYRSKRFLNPDNPYDAAIIAISKRGLENELVKVIKEHITYKVDTVGLTPTIIASIFIGEEE